MLWDLSRQLERILEKMAARRFSLNPPIASRKVLRRLTFTVAAMGIVLAINIMSLDNWYVKLIFGDYLKQAFICAVSGLQVISVWSARRQPMRLLLLVSTVSRIIEVPGFRFLDTLVLLAMMFEFVETRKNQRIPE